MTTHVSAARLTIEWAGKRRRGRERGLSMRKGHGCLGKGARATLRGREEGPHMSEPGQAQPRLWATRHHRIPNHSEATNTASCVCLTWEISAKLIIWITGVYVNLTIITETLHILQGKIMECFTLEKTNTQLMICTKKKKNTDRIVTYTICVWSALIDVFTFF